MRAQIDHHVSPCLRWNTRLLRRRPIRRACERRRKTACAEPSTLEGDRPHALLWRRHASMRVPSAVVTSGASHESNPSHQCMQTARRALRRCAERWLRVAIRTSHEETRSVQSAREPRAVLARVHRRESSGAHHGPPLPKPPRADRRAMQASAVRRDLVCAVDISSDERGGRAGATLFSRFENRPRRLRHGALG